MISENDVLQGAYAGAQDAGYRVVGLCKIESETVLVGPKDAPVELGRRVSLTVREAASGRLLPRLEDAGPDDPPARWLLHVDVYPDVRFDEGGADGRVVWICHVRRLDVASNRVVGVGMSGLPRDAERTLQDGRPPHEYLSDPAYVEAIRGAEATTPSAAVAEALRRLPSPPAATPGRRLRRTLTAGGIVATAAVGIGWVAFAGDDGSAPAAVETSTAAPSAVETSADVPSTTLRAAPASSDTPRTTIASTTGPEPTAVIAPMEIFTTTVLIFGGTQDAVQTWNVGDSALVNQEALSTPFEFFVLTNPSGAGNTDLFALASPPECSAATTSECPWVLEVYEHVGGVQHSSATEVGAVPFGVEKTFLADGHDQGTALDVGQECAWSMTHGELPVHPTTADDFGIGVYYPNAENTAHTDAVFVELGPPTEVPVVVVRQGGSTAIAVASPDAEAANCYSWGATSTSISMLLEALAPTFCAARQVDPGLELCDGTALDWVEFAEVLRAQPTTPAIEEMLRQIEVGNVVGLPDEVGLIADALALSLVLGR